MNATDEAALDGWPTEQEQADLAEYEADERAAGRDPWDDDERPTLESCWCGEHRACPDGWHPEPDEPGVTWCGCTADCALDDEDDR